MDERESCLDSRIIITLDIAYVTCVSQMVALCDKPDILIFLEKIIAVAFDVFDKVIRAAIRDLIIPEE